MARYRLTYRGEPVGEWRATSREAHDDAERLKHGERDEWGRFYLFPFAEVEVDAG